MKCQNCGETLPQDSTIRRKYCNDVCRVAHNRLKRRKTATLSDSMQAIVRLGGEMADSKKAYDAAKSLMEMRKTIDKYLPSLSSWWKCESCGRQEMAFIPNRTHCNCGDNARWFLVK